MTRRETHAQCVRADSPVFISILFLIFSETYFEYNLLFLHTLFHFFVSDGSQSFSYSFLGIFFSRDHYCLLLKICSKLYKVLYFSYFLKYFAWRILQFQDMKVPALVFTGFLHFQVHFNLMNIFTINQSILQACDCKVDFTYPVNSPTAVPFWTTF